MIDPKLITENKQRLLQEEQRLKNLLSRIARPLDNRGDFQTSHEQLGSKEDENALEVADYAEHIAEEHDLALRLQKVMAALERIRDGSYGQCQIGGEDIPASRLLAVPEAENCIEHEQK